MDNFVKYATTALVIYTLLYVCLVVAFTIAAVRS
jgi:hypothetical protein